MNTRILRTETRTLPVKLTEGELLERSQRAATLLCEAEREEEALDLERKTRKQAIAELEADGRRLLRSVELGSEPRDVDVQLIADYDLRAIVYVRTDTGDSYFSRAMTPDEAQLALLPAPVTEQGA